MQFRHRLCRRGGWVRIAAVTVLAGGVAAALALIGWHQMSSTPASGASGGGGSAEWHRVERRSFDLVITAPGELDALRRVEVQNQVRVSRPSIIEVIDEGVEVRGARYFDVPWQREPFTVRGEVLVRLDTEEIDEKIGQTRLDVEEARAAHVAADQSLQIELNEATRREQAARVELELAELALMEWSEGKAPQQRRELKLELDTAQRRVERAKRDYKLSQELYDQQFISLNELEDSELEVINAADALATAQLNQRVYEQYTHQQEKQKAQSDVDQAKAELTKVLARNESDIARLRADLKSKERTLLLRENKLDELLGQKAAATIYAPQDGMVVYASSLGRRRNDPLAVGQQVHPGQTLILLPDTRQMVAEVRVHETRVAQVDAGQPVAVRIDARAQEVIPGEVVSVSTMAAPTHWSSDVKEYTVRVELPTGKRSIKPGMQCTAEIATGRVTDAVAVPVQCVHTEGDRQFVYVPAGQGKVQPLEVELGDASVEMVEIVKGLEPGDRVLLRRPRPGEVRDS